MERKNQTQLKQAGNPFSQTSKKKSVTNESSLKSSYHCPSLMNSNNIENNMDQALPRSMSTMQNSVVYGNGNELINNEAYVDAYTRTPNVEQNKNQKTSTISLETFNKSNRMNNRMQLI